MERVNHEYYISLEIAKLLKETGFNWECEYAYMPSTEMGNVPFKHLYNRTNYNELHYEVYSAPTLDVTQRWLREVKNMSVEISFEKPGKWSCSVILDTNKGISFENFWREEFDYDIYEEAQEAGIKKALKIILEK